MKIKASIDRVKNWVQAAVSWVRAAVDVTKAAVKPAAEVAEDIVKEVKSGLK